MSVNRTQVDRWKEDVRASIDFYNSWFMEFAPKAFRDTRNITITSVSNSIVHTNNLLNISIDVLKNNPEILPILRMCTCPPIARDRLIGLGDINPNLVKTMELNSRLPKLLSSEKLDIELKKIVSIIQHLLDPDIFPWVAVKDNPTENDVFRASSIIADRLCGSLSDPIIRNAQEKRQLAAIRQWLEQKGYVEFKSVPGSQFMEMPAGTFSFRMNVPVFKEDKKTNMPIDAVIKPIGSDLDTYPLLFEAKSAGDVTNTNKRRKEEAIKMQQLRHTYGDNINFNLFLCGYFDSGYLGYEASEGIDWVWEHSLAQFGI
ncbi:XamI family restriction endonuclease (plasmid) [Acinetobacter sp. ESL0695]|uniref:XamI family restriction endonuclease n=1 Tax=Acinetobacter sp. ESL0695 TaxID=2983215 RepID=UPI0023F1E605|nr:XamI family restriction endonuclease [Acinetobacter sp. ESL0695]WEV50079.1 XamI family restriction endonuclease [Acinetobacter sp. ESL0695]